MSAALVLAFTLAAAGPAPAAPQDADIGELFRQACAETGMRREAFEALGRERRWRRARLTTDARTPDSWSVAFRIDRGIVVLGYEPDFSGGDSGLGSVCSVTVDRASPSLADEMAVLAASLGLGEEAPFLEQPPGTAPMRVWSRFGDKTLTYAAAPDGRAAITLSRQVVSILPTPASPPGN